MNGVIMTQYIATFGRLFLLVSAAAIAAPALATSLTIVNPSFEGEVLTCAPGFFCFVDGIIPGWSVSSIPQTATFKPSIGAGGEFPGGIPDGVNVAAVGNQTATGAISQTLSVNLQANTVYTLSAAVGNRADFPYSGYSMELDAGSNVLMSSSAVNPAPGKFLADSFSFTTTASTVGLGQPIVIRFSSLVSDAQVDFDTVALTAVPVAAPVPEPGTYAMMLAGMGVLAVCALRRKQQANAAA
jgi:hypothetical protein